MIEGGVLGAERVQAGHRIARKEMLQIGVVVQLAQQGVGVGRGKIAGLPSTGPRRAEQAAEPRPREAQARGEPGGRYNRSPGPCRCRCRRVVEETMKTRGAGLAERAGRWPRPWPRCRPDRLPRTNARESPARSPAPCCRPGPGAPAGEDLAFGNCGEYCKSSGG